MGESSQSKRIEFAAYFQYKQAARKRGMTLGDYLDSLLEPLASEAGMSKDDYVTHKMREGLSLSPPQTK